MAADQACPLRLKLITLMSSDIKQRIMTTSDYISPEIREIGLCADSLFCISVQVETEKLDNLNEFQW